MRHVRSPGPVVALLAVVAVAGCARMLPGGGPSATAPQPSAAEVPSAAAPQPSAAEVPSVVPSPTPCPFGGGEGSYYYGSFEEFASMTDGVAVVRVTSVGPVQYPTADGERPSCAPETEAWGVGRLIEAELVTLVRGTWPNGSAAYWLPGGTIGADRTTETGFEAELPDPVAGELAVAFLLSRTEDLDVGDGVLPIDIGLLFPVNTAGRVITPDPLEIVLVDEVPTLLGTD